MKKQTFILLLYFFVVQCAIAGYLRQNDNFYILGTANLLFLMVFQFVSNISKDIKKSEKKVEQQVQTDKKISVKNIFHNFCKNYFFAISIFLLLISIIGKIIFDYTPRIVLGFLLVFFVTMIVVWKDIIERKTHFGKKLFLPKDYLFWISLVLATFIYSNLGAIILGSRILIASLIGFLFFTICVRSLKLIGGFQFKKLKMTKFYLVIIIIGIGLTGYQFYNGVTKNKLISGNQQFMEFSYQYLVNGINNLSESVFGSGKIIIKEKTEDIKPQSTGEQLIFTGQGEVINTSGEVVNSEVLDSGSIESLNTGNIEVLSTGNEDIYNSGDIEVLGSGSVKILETGDLEVLNTGVIVGKPIVLIDILKNLFEENNVSLVTKKDIKFIWVSQSHSRFKYFRTAYHYGLIGKNANPEKELACENYIVMKGIIEKWETIGKTNENYWNKAIELDKLNGCEKGKNVQTNNL